MIIQDKKIKRYQYTAFADSPHERALKLYPEHTQKNTFRFVDRIIGKFPFRIHMIHIDDRYEFQAKCPWHVEDHGIRHVKIKPCSRQLNGKGERSHRSDQEESHQLLSYVDNKDLNKN